MEGKATYATLVLSMVSIPVAATNVIDSTDRPKTKRLHEPCLTPITQPWHCSTCKKPAAGEAITGYEVGKGLYLPLTASEMASVDPGRVKTITVSKFVPVDSWGLSETLALTTDKSYWLSPQDEIFSGPYALLREAIAEQKVVGLAFHSVWGKQWAAVISPVGDRLSLTNIFPASAQRLANGFPIPEVKKSDLKLAKMLVSEFTGELEASVDFQPPTYDELKQLVAAKAAGQTFTPMELPDPEPTPDILDAIRASLAKTKARTKVKA